MTILKHVRCEILVKIRSLQWFIHAKAVTDIRTDKHTTKF